MELGFEVSGRVNGGSVEDKGREERAVGPPLCLAILRFRLGVATDRPTQSNGNVRRKGKSLSECPRRGRYLPISHL